MNYSNSTWHFFTPENWSIGSQYLLSDVQEELDSTVGFGMSCAFVARVAELLVQNSSFGRKQARTPTDSFQNLGFAFFRDCLDLHWFSQYIFKINISLSFLDAHQ